jgi:transposase-like protein
VVYVALGVTPEGEREVLGLWIANNEGAKFWLSVMNNLRNRGVEDILKPFLTRHAQHAAERAPSPAYLQASTVNNEVDRGLLVRSWTRLQYHAVSPARQG